MIAFIFMATTITIYLHHKYNNMYIEELLEDPPKNEVDEFEDILQFLSDIKLNFDL
jgi:hypothetical protein